MKKKGKRWLAMFLGAGLLMILPGCQPAPNGGSHTSKDETGKVTVKDYDPASDPDRLPPAGPRTAAPADYRAPAPCPAWSPDFVVPEYTVPAANTDRTSPQNTALSFPVQNDPAQNSAAQFLGFNHINIGYTFLNRDALTEGGLLGQELGSKVIKVYLESGYAFRYAPNTDWGTATPTSCLELAQHPYYKALFEMDYDTFIIGAYIFDASWGNPATYWNQRFPKEACQREYTEMYELTYYLCTAYAGTGKTFIIQNWEGDWASKVDTDPSIDATEGSLDRMIAWANTRQDAVMAAREAAGKDGVSVYHALEVNLVDKAQRGGVSVTNNVIPYTYCDFYSYSAYDTIMSPDRYAQALDYLKQKVSQNRTGGKSGVFVGELSAPEVYYGHKEVMAVLPDAIRTAREKGYAHVLFWSLYEETPKNDDRDYMGYWLIKRSGAVAEMWNVVYRYINGTDSPRYLAYLKSLKNDLPARFAFSQEGAAIEEGILVTDINDSRLVGRGFYSLLDTVNTLPLQGQADSALSLTLYAGAGTAGRHTVSLAFLDNGEQPITFVYPTAGGKTREIAIPRTATKTWKIASFVLDDLAMPAKADAAVCTLSLKDNGDPLFLHKITITPTNG